ncbi:MAG: LLM class flavin-dependent oxidoreductase [Actinomycetota bacterium]|nr:LLM class flavin-dependent oxidoreductase [Actinomycetota bacterium]MDH4352714.1 LLM class flavin-dependent oxidoreductase [Actinomycetota bacterium]MDH5278260.1 LLM class flavin-dependent oxidoreductase [Actinomycetota bacterium]
MAALDFGVYLTPRDGRHSHELLRRAEDSDLDTVWVGDTLGDWRDLDAPLLDTWVTLGALAVESRRVRLGMLVTNLAWRRPVEVARFAMTVDQLSGGRFTLGLGCGEVDDQVMAGVDVLTMAPRERVDRLAEGVVVIDRLLRGDRSAFHGRFTSYDAAATAPGSVQQPRLPLMVAGNGPRITRLAADRADIWNTWIDNGDADAFHALTVDRMQRFDERLVANGRGLAAVTRSLLVFDDVMQPWADDDAVPRLVAQFRPLGFTQFVFYPPGPDQLEAFSRITTRVLPSLRG